MRVPPARQPARTQDSPSCAPPGPRLLTRQQAADYLNLSSDMLDRLTQQGELPRVQLLMGNRNVRKVLYDRADLDRLVELSRTVRRLAPRGSILEVAYPPSPKNRRDRAAWEELQPQVPNFEPP